jgi:hypothetical protein
MATEETTDAPVDEEVDEEEVSAEAHTADPVPGAVTEDTPKMSKKAAAAEGQGPLPTDGQGFAQLADTDNVAELGVTPGTRVYVISAGPQELVEGSDFINPQTVLAEDANVVVRTRDAASATLTVKVEDLEPVAAGAAKG